MTIPAAIPSANPDLAATDDPALVAAAQADPIAFGPLYARYVLPIYRYCASRLGDRAAAEDATSQTFTQALAALPRFRPEAGTFRGWLFTIAHNAVADIKRRRPTLDLDAAAAIPDPGRSPEEHALAAEARRALMTVLDALPPDQRAVVDLRLAGLTGPEIAAVLGKRPEAVKSTQFRAYTRLRRLLGVAQAPEADRESH